MIKGKDIYDVLAAIVPLYVAMVLGYGSVQWWQILVGEQCAGISRFVSVYALPIMSFHLISTSDPYAMNYQFLAADCLQKVVILVSLFAWAGFCKKGSFDWTITLFSLSSLPNTLVVGIPLLRAMYGDSSANLMVQIVFLQAVLWYTILLVMFEYRGAKLLIRDHFPDTGGAIASIRVESDVRSLNGSDLVHTDAQVSEDGKLHVVLKRLKSKATNLTDVEIYSVQSSRSSFNRMNGLPMFNRSSHRYSKSLDGDFQSFRMHPPNNTPSDAKNMSQDQDHHMFAWSSSASSYASTRVGAGTVADTSIPVFRPENEDHVSAEDGTKQEMPPTGVMTKLILIMVWRTLIRNTNTYASIFGLVWSLISFRWHIEMPLIVSGSITILSNTGLGMAMFSLGLFMALQEKVIGCGISMALYSMVVRFIAGPAITAAASLAVGLRGVLLNVAIVQAALPQGIVPFVYAKEYNLHPDILSTAVIFGMMVAIPVTILYYIVLGFL